MILLEEIGTSSIIELEKKITSILNRMTLNTTDFLSPFIRKIKWNKYEVR
jgi:hypothetical protein